jgi:uncharacterized protein (DUF1697 family)
VSERIGLLRAVNVGGARLPMARLRVIAESLGAQEVSTYIASGNLLYTPPGEASEFDAALERAIEDEFGYALTGTPTVEAATALAQRAGPTEHVAVIGRELHLRYDDGAANATLTPAVIKRTLGYSGTGRNLDTVGRLVELATG